MKELELEIKELYKWIDRLKENTKKFKNFNTNIKILKYFRSSLIEKTAYLTSVIDTAKELEKSLEKCKKCDCWSEELGGCSELVLCKNRKKIIKLFEIIDDLRKISKKGEINNV